MLEIMTGATRTVVLFGSWAIKFAWVRDPHHFLPVRERTHTGVCANDNESRWSKVEFEQMNRAGIGFCPVKFRCPGSWFIIMPRCRYLTHEEWYRVRLLWQHHCLGELDMVELKYSSFGVLPNGRVVVIDYGN